MLTTSVTEFEGHLGGNDYLRGSSRIGLGAVSVGPKERDLIKQVLDTGRLSYGPLSREFEQKFAAAHGCRFGILTNSGTSSLMAALAALKEKHGWKPGDEIIIPSVTFIATGNAVLHLGLRPVFADVDPFTYNLDAEQFERAITKRTRAVIPVHLFGLPCDMDAITAVARRYGLKVVEDSCEAMGVTYKERPVGSFSDYSCFSFYMAHLLVTGVGGMVLTSDNESEQLVRSIAFHGRDNSYLSIDDDDNLSDDRLSEIVDRRFLFARLGYNFRLTELEAALGLGQLERLGDIVATRQRNAAYLADRLGPLQDRLQLPICPEHSTHAYMMFPIMVRDPQKVSRKGVVMHLERRGIETRYALPLLNQPAYVNELGVRIDDFPVAAWMAAGGFYIGCHQGLTQEDLDYMAETINDYFRMK